MMLLVLRFVSVIAFVGNANGLLLDGADAETTAARLDNLEAMLTEEKQRRVELEQRFSQCDCQGTGYPAFMASLSADVTQCTRHQHIVFDDVKTNVGGAYSGAHGIFTAPVAGTYAFSTKLGARSSKKYNVAIVKNNVTNNIATLYCFNEDGTKWQIRSTSTVTHLHAGDEVWMVCLDDSTMEGYNSEGAAESDTNSHMSGFLISPDLLS